MDEKILIKLGMQQIVIDDCLRSLLFARKLSNESCSLFYRYVTTALFKNSIINWCIVFGSHNEDLHWSKIQSHFGEQAYSVTNILEDCHIDMDEWEAYHQTIRSLRDQFFAHFDIRSLETYVPSLDIILQTSLSYRDWIIGRIENMQNEEPSIHRNFFDTSALLDDIEVIFNSK